MREIKFKDEKGEITVITPKIYSRMFTGFHDKNGSEIYSGDEVKWTDYYGTDHFEVVRWSQDLGRWDLSDDGTLSLASILRSHPLELS